MKRFISFSGGVESTTMLILYGRGATVLLCDTGDEFDLMHDRWNEVIEKVTALHDGNIEFVDLKGEVKIQEEVINNLPDAAMAWKFFPSWNARYCTKSFKIEPIDNYLSEQGECELLIGFNADEQPGADRTGNYMKCKNVKYSYPLFDDGYTREDCIEILIEHDLNPNFPVYMQRGGCRKCFFKKRTELKALCIFDRKTFDEDELFEKQIQDRRGKFYAINGNAMDGYKGVREEVEREVALWGIDALQLQYSKIKSHEPCGAFCHR